MFKFVFSCQPLYYYIHKVLQRCPTERYIKPVRIPGYLCFYVEIKLVQLQTRYISNSLITCTVLKIFSQDICLENNKFQVCLFMR